MDAFGQIFWLFIMLSMLQPLLAQRMLEARRLGLIRLLEKRRGSRVILLVHRQETLGFLGFPIFRYIDVNDSEEVLRAIRMTSDDCPIDLILHTPGGMVLAASQIAEAVRAHPAPVTVHVPHYAMSGGTLIALAADRILMDPAAVLGQVDPQLGNRPAAALVRLLEAKPVEKIDDETWIQADMARRALEQVEAEVRRLVGDRLEGEALERLLDALARGRYTHDHPIRYDEALALGLPVSDALPEEVHQLMALHPQPRNRQPAVQYIPHPYGDGPRGAEEPVRRH